jgi:hypothetical protein
VIKADFNTVEDSLENRNVLIFLKIILDRIRIVL